MMTDADVWTARISHTYAHVFYRFHAGADQRGVRLSGEPPLYKIEKNKKSGTLTATGAEQSAEQRDRT